MHIRALLVLGLLLVLAAPALAEAPLGMFPRPECDHPAVVELDFEIKDGKHKPVVAETEIEQLWVFTVADVSPLAKDATQVVAIETSLRVSVPEWVTVVEVKGGTIERTGHLLAELGDVTSGETRTLTVRVKVVPPKANEHLEVYRSNLFYKEPGTLCSKPNGVSRMIFPRATTP